MSVVAAPFCSSSVGVVSSGYNILGLLKCTALLPERYGTTVGAKGISLSGDQK